MTISEQARADAMADAETLLRFHTSEKLETMTGLLRAYVCCAEYPKVAGHYGRQAAQAAFMVVPGLRG